MTEAGARPRPCVLVVLLVAVLAGCARTPPGHTETPREGADTSSQELPARVVAVLCYHGMSASSSDRYEVSTSEFKEQLQLLRDEGFQSVTASQIADYLDGKQDLPEKAVALTFDDNPRSILTESKPLMDEHGFVGTAFLITQSVGAQGNLTWDDVAQLQEAGWEIGSHTVSHADPTKLEADQLAEEFAGSKAAVEEHVSSEVAALAYPYGNYDSEVMRQAREANYRIAFSIDRGPADNTDDPMRLPRQMVVNGNSIKTFSRWLHQEKVHFADLSPQTGEHLGTTTPTFTARLADEAVPLSEIELTARDKRVKCVPSEDAGTFTFTPELSKGANIIRANYWGSPQREVSWVVICDAG